MRTTKIRCVESAYYQNTVRRECVIPQVRRVGSAYYQKYCGSVRTTKKAVRRECVLQKKAYRRYASSRISSILRYTDSILRTLKMPENTYRRYARKKEPFFIYISKGKFVKPALLPKRFGKVPEFSLFQCMLTA